MRGRSTAMSTAGGLGDVVVTQKGDVDQGSCAKGQLQEIHEHMECKIHQVHTMQGSNIETGVDNISGLITSKIFDVRANLYILCCMPEQARKCLIHIVLFTKKYKSQSKFDFGYVPLSEQRMPNKVEFEINDSMSAIDLHERAKAAGVPNFLGA